MKENFLRSFEANKRLLFRIKEVVQRGSLYIQGSPEFKKSSIESIFISYIYEYLYKYQKLNTIKYMNQNASFEEIFQKIEISNYSQFNQIVDQLKRKDCTDAIEWAFKNRPKLKKINSDFEYQVLFLHLLNMLNEKKDSKQLLAFIQDSISQSTTDLDKIFACLQFCLVKKQPVLPSITFEEVLKEFYRIFFTIEGYDQSLFFENIILSGIKVVKTPLCRVTQKHKSKSFCPACSKWVFLMGEEVKPALRANTIVFCSASN